MSKKLACLSPVNDITAEEAEIIRFDKNQDLVEKQAQKIESLKRLLKIKCAQHKKQLVAKDVELADAVRQARNDKDNERDEAVAQARLDKDIEWAQIRDDAVEACKTACDAQHAVEIDQLKRRHNKEIAKKLAHRTWAFRPRKVMHTMYNQMKAKIISSKAKFTGEITTLKGQLASKDERIVDLEDTLQATDVELSALHQTITNVDLKERIKKHDEEMLFLIERVKMSLEDSAPGNRLEGRDLLHIRDLTHSMIHSSIALLDPEEHIFISHVMLQMGYYFTCPELAKIGKRISDRHLDMFGHRPTKHTQYVDGHTLEAMPGERTGVCSYTKESLPMIKDELYRAWMFKSNGMAID